MNRPPTSLAGYKPKTSAGDCRWDAKAAARAIDFFPAFLAHIKGPLAGKPFELEKWERDIIGTLFGWKRPDGTRRYREAMIGIPRKNGKTTLAAGLALYLLCCDNEEGAEVYCAACDREQATLVFDPAAKMVQRSRALAKRCKVLESVKRIVFEASSSFMRAIPADSAGSHGFNAHAVIVDELHTQPTRDLYDVLKTSMAARMQPLLVSITTAGSDRTSICFELWEHARQVRDGVREDPYFLPVLYEANEDEDWQSERLWKRCNPNLGKSVTVGYLQEAAERARKTPAFENTFRNLHLNQWTESSDRWIGSEAWDACRGEFPDLTGQPCFAAFDLGSTDDLTCLVAAWPYDGRIYVRRWSWCPEDTIRNAPKRFQSQYRSWRDRGLICETPGAATDYDFVRAKFLELAGLYEVQAVGFDAWQAMDSFNFLDARGFNCEKVPQTFAGLGPGTKATEEAILSGRLVHDGDPVLAWMVASTVMEIDANGNRKPNKRKSQGPTGTIGKIDAVVAMVMAVGLATLAPEKLGSIYETAGNMSL